MTSKRPCASPEWQCEQVTVITHLLYSPRLDSVQRKSYMSISPGLEDFTFMASGFCLMLAQWGGDLDLYVAEIS